MKELDLLLLRYLRQQLPRKAREDRAVFAEFLELPDPQIARYLIAGDLPEDGRFDPLCRALRTP